MTSTSKQPWKLSIRASTLVAIGIAGYFLFRIFYPTIAAEIRRPKDPDRLPALAFLNRINLTGEPSRTQDLEVTGGKDSTYPAWWYVSKMKPQALAHILKTELTKAKGWTLQFPDLAEPYAAEGEHRTDGKIDWTFKTEAAGATSGLIVIYRA